MCRLVVGASLYRRRYFRYDDLGRIRPLLRNPRDAIKSFVGRAPIVDEKRVDEEAIIETQCELWWIDISFTAIDDDG